MTTNKEKLQLMLIEKTAKYFAALLELKQVEYELLNINDVPPIDGGKVYEITEDEINKKPLNGKRKYVQYPFDSMEIGDILKVPYDRIRQQSIYTSIKNFRIKHPTRKFKTRTNKTMNVTIVTRIN